MTGDERPTEPADTGQSRVVLLSELGEWREVWTQFRQLAGAGNTPEIRSRLRELLARGDALALRR